MTQSMHDLRLALRDSVKKFEDLENTTNKLRTDYENQLRKKEIVISPNLNKKFRNMIQHLCHQQILMMESILLHHHEHHFSKYLQ
jgi:hypothetical protein